MAALGGLDSDLAPTDLYRLVQALTQIDPQQVTGCIVGGTVGTSEDGGSIVNPDIAQARRLGKDAFDDTRLAGLRRHPLGQSGLAGEDDRLRTVRHLQLGEDVARVVAHRLDRQLSARAISAFSRPSAIFPRISRSRSVSSGNASAVGRLRAERK